MIRKTHLFTSGPTSFLPAAQLAMATANMHPDTPEFRALYFRVLTRLAEFVGTRNDVVLLSSSGTGAMEAAVSNLTSPGDRVLVLSAGTYGERWTTLAANFGCAVEVVRAPYGGTFSLDGIKAMLKLETRAVFVQATESSTGAQHDVEAIAKLLQAVESEALLVVDATTGLGTTHLDMDGWGVDVLIGESQTLMTSPGLSFLALSEKAWDRMEATYNPRFYFDLRKERRSARRGESAYTPPIALIAAVDASLQWIAAQSATTEDPAGSVAEGRNLLVANAATIAAMTRAAMIAMGMKLFAPEVPSSAVTAVLPPEGTDAGLIVQELNSRFGAILTEGHGEMQGKIFRIAHPGFVDPMDTLALIGAMEQVMVKSLPGSAVKFGDGLIAAQQVYAERAVTRSHLEQPRR